MRVFYLRNAVKFPVAAVASELSKRGNEAWIEFALSICNPKDLKAFDKARMRKMAQERLVLALHGSSRPKIDLLSGSILVKGNVKAEIMRWIEANHELPKQVQEAALYWLEHPVEHEDVTPDSHLGGVSA